MILCGYALLILLLFIHLATVEHKAREREQIRQERYNRFIKI